MPHADLNQRTDTAMATALWLKEERARLRCAAIETVALTKEGIRAAQEDRASRRVWSEGGDKADPSSRADQPASPVSPGGIPRVASISPSINARES